MNPIAPPLLGRRISFACTDPPLREKKNHMNHLIDTDDKQVEVCRSGCDPAFGLDPEGSNPKGGRATRQSACQMEDNTHLKFLETLIDKTIKRLEDKSCKPRIQDALKAIQLKQKLVKTSEAEKIFWQAIEAIRREELSKLYPEPIDLESQITNTIAGLRYLVTNGILPVKTITDTFNQSRSKESQLTYSRLGRILSAMGFRKTKTSNGSSAILWDDQLLHQDTDINIHNSLQENDLEACP